MAHYEQREFINYVKGLFPDFFKEKFILDIGSLDINGSNLDFFEDCGYIGVDLGYGKNVDIVCKGHELCLPDETFDVVISTETFEHDPFYQETLKNMYRLLKKGGLMIFTCATTGRPEHGTERTSPGDAPFISMSPDKNIRNYYKNLTEEDIRSVLNIEELFEKYEFKVNPNSCDLYFWGIKKGEFINYTGYSFIRKKRRSVASKVNSKKNIATGFCNVCGNYSTFIKDSDNLRETYICKFCNSISRERHLAKVFSKKLSDGLIDNIKSLLNSRIIEKKLIYNTQCYGSIHNTIRHLEGYICSEFFPDYEFGKLTDDGTLNQDLQSLTFTDETFDVVITQDVLEHVENPWKAFKEINRVLKLGGIHIFTIPYSKETQTRSRVEVVGSEKIFLHPPVYHQDPHNPSGILVYTDFGYDLPDKLIEFGFETEVYYSTEEDELENRIYWNVVFVSKKKNKVGDNDR